MCKAEDEDSISSTVYSDSGSNRSEYETSQLPLSQLTSVSTSSEHETLLRFEDLTERLLQFEKSACTTNIEDENLLRPEALVERLRQFGEAVKTKNSPYSCSPAAAGTSSLPSLSPRSKSKTLVTRSSAESSSGPCDSSDVSICSSRISRKAVRFATGTLKLKVPRNNVWVPASTKRLSSRNSEQQQDRSHSQGKSSLIERHLSLFESLISGRGIISTSTSTGSSSVVPSALCSSISEDCMGESRTIKPPLIALDDSQHVECNQQQKQYNNCVSWPPPPHPPSTLADVDGTPVPVEHNQHMTSGPPLPRSARLPTSSFGFGTGNELTDMHVDKSSSAERHYANINNNMTPGPPPLRPLPRPTSSFTARAGNALFAIHNTTQWPPPPHPSSLPGSLATLHDKPRKQQRSKQPKPVLALLDDTGRKQNNMTQQCANITSWLALPKLPNDSSAGSGVDQAEERNDMQRVVSKKAIDAMVAAMGDDEQDELLSFIQQRYDPKTIKRRARRKSPVAVSKERQQKEKKVTNSRANNDEKLRRANSPAAASKEKQQVKKSSAKVANKEKSRQSEKSLPTAKVCSSTKLNCRSKESKSRRLSKSSDKQHRSSRHAHGSHNVHKLSSNNEDDNDMEARPECRVPDIQRLRSIHPPKLSSEVSDSSDVVVMENIKKGGLVELQQRGDGNGTVSTSSSTGGTSSDLSCSHSFTPPSPNNSPNANGAGNVNVRSWNHENGAILSNRGEISNCDSKGRCFCHAQNRLRKNQLLGSWRDLMTACPDCCVEELQIFRLSQLCNTAPLEWKDSNTASAKIISIDVSRQDCMSANGSLAHTIKDYNSDAAMGKENTMLIGNQASPKIMRDAPIPRNDSNETHFFVPSVKTKNTVNAKPSNNKKEKNKQLTQVLHMDWTDINGIQCSYSGAVNSDFFPHGNGVMKYDRHMRIEGVWKKGQWKRQSHPDEKSASRGNKKSSGTSRSQSPYSRKKMISKDRRTKNIGLTNQTSLSAPSSRVSMPLVRKEVNSSKKTQRAQPVNSAIKSSNIKGRTSGSYEWDRPGRSKSPDATPYSSGGSSRRRSCSRSRSQRRSSTREEEEHYISSSESNVCSASGNTSRRSGRSRAQSEVSGSASRCGSRGRGSSRSQNDCHARLKKKQTGVY